MRIFSLFLLLIYCLPLIGQKTIKILNFQGDNGYQHESKREALKMIELLAAKNKWEVVTTPNPDVMNRADLATYDVIVFNNNCGTDGSIFSEVQSKAFQQYIRSGGGFVGIHCAGAIWHEETDFQKWYEHLIGTRLIAHPQVQEATLIVENQSHDCSSHLPRQWQLKDEWHTFSSNPRPNVNVLLSLDESTYEGDSSVKMGGDHPFTWYQYFEGGRSFFTSIGHTKEVYHNAAFQKLVEGGIRWAAGNETSDGGLLSNGLILDLDADKEVTTTPEMRVLKWTNQVKNFSAQDFVTHDYGLRLSKPGSGQPILKINLEELNGHNVLSFEEDELVNMQEDAFDYLITGSGYTWLTVLKPYQTADPSGDTELGLYRLKDVNSFLGNLRNGGSYEGLWGSLNDDLTLWCGSRNGITFGRFDENNPKLLGPQLEADKFYIIAARMGSGIDKVDIEIFVNSALPYASIKYPVNQKSNPSKLAIGTERDATNHPGSESFDGEIARLLIYERPLSNDELAEVVAHLKNKYQLGK